MTLRCRDATGEREDEQCAGGGLISADAERNAATQTYFLLDDEGRQFLLPLLDVSSEAPCFSYASLLRANERPACLRLRAVVELVDDGPDGTQGAGLGMHGSEGMREVSGRGIGGCSIAQLPPCGLKGNPNRSPSLPL